MLVPIDAFCHAAAADAGGYDLHLHLHRKSPLYSYSQFWLSAPVQRERYRYSFVHNIVTIRT